MLRKLTQMLKKGEAGFTLIELMIVILVILILAAILVPQFGLAQERARKAKCVSNQRNLETAVAMWATDNTALNYASGTMNASSPGFGALTGSPQYTTSGAFTEPDHSVTATGADYFLSNGAATAGAQPATSANAAAPSYGHVACAYDGVTDPWVNNDDAVGAGTTLNHTRGAAATP